MSKEKKKKKECKFGELRTLVWVDNGIVGGKGNWVKAMSTNNKLYMSLDRQLDRQRGSWADVMSTNS
jgi:hypothetical protein